MDSVLESGKFFAHMKKSTELSLGSKLRLLRKKYCPGGLRELVLRMKGQFSISGISRRERGEFSIDRGYIEAFCEAVELPEREKELLFRSIDLSILGAKADSLEYSAAMTRLVEAAQFLDRHALTIPSLLQTLDYTHAIIRNYHQRDDLREAAVERRQRWDKFLNRHGRRLRMSVPESALYTAIGSPEIMRGQIQRLLDFVPSAEVEFRVLPSDVFVGVPIHYFFDVVDGVYATSENYHNTASEDDPAKIERLAKNFEVIWQASATGEALKAILEKALKTYR